MTPRRIQRKRTKGWRMPEGAVYVGRPGKWGNPFKVGERTHLWHMSAAYPFQPYRDWFTVGHAEQATGLYRKTITQPGEFHMDNVYSPTTLAIRTELAGKDLACWCPLDQPCHADVLLEIANGDHQ